MKAAFECAKNETERIKENHEDITAGVEQCQGVNLTHGEKGRVGKGPGKERGSGKGPKGSKGPRGFKFPGKGGPGDHDFQWHDPCDIFKGVPPPVHDSKKPQGGPGGFGPPKEGSGRPPKEGSGQASDGKRPARRPN